MFKISAVRAASSISQHLLLPLSQNFNVMPMTSKPATFSKYAVTALSTPPDIPTITLPLLITNLIFLTNITLNKQWYSIKPSMSIGYNDRYFWKGANAND